MALSFLAAAAAAPLFFLAPPKNLFCDFAKETIYLMKDSGRDERVECNPPVSRMDTSVFHALGKTMEIQFGPSIGGQTALYSTLRNGELRRIHFGDLPNAIIDVS